MIKLVGDTIKRVNVPSFVPTHKKEKSRNNKDSAKSAAKRSGNAQKNVVMAR